MHTFLTISNGTLFIYYLLSNLCYLALLVTAILKNTEHQERLGSLKLERLKASPFTPPITLVVPAHNEEKSIVESIRSLLSIDYPSLELVVINDGSQDTTLDQLKQAYRLRSANILYIQTLPSGTVHGVFNSPIEPRLLVLDKDSTGSKADAVNAGLNAASSPYVCVVDADSILERDSLLRIMAGVLSDPSRVMAVGGIVRVLNGSKVRNGELHDVRLPKKGIEVLQVIEYLRAFLIGREAWSKYNMLPIISGAFGIFRRDVVMKVQGFRAAAVGEDFDLVMRVHRYLLEQGKDYVIEFIPDPTCWTEVPADLRSLARQRARWHKGLLDTLWPNRDMLFRKRYGRIGSIALPYMWLFEFFAPIIECVGFITIIVAAVLGLLSRQFFLQFLLFGYAFATMISVGAVLLEEMTYRRYSDWREVARLLLYCMVEHFPYRQMTMIWRLQGIYQYLRGDMKWREMKRIGIPVTPA